MKPRYSSRGIVCTSSPPTCRKEPLTSFVNVPSTSSMNGAVAGLSRDSLENPTSVPP